ECATHIDGALAVLHSVIKLNRPSLLRRKSRMRGGNYGCRFGPGPVVGRIDLVRHRLSDVEHARKDEVLKNLIIVAEGTGVPPKPIEAQGMRCDPAPAGLGLRHRLVTDLDCVVLAYRTQDSLEDP